MTDLKKSPRRKLGDVDLAKLDRLPPHSMEAEQGVLGCILLDPNTALPTCVSKFKAGTETFYDLRHQTLYDEFVAMSEEHAPIDLITLQQRLKDKNQLEAVGGITYIAQLQDAVPSAANLSYYTGILLEKRTLRRLLSTCTGVISRIYETESEVDAFVDGVEAEVLKACEERVEVADQGMHGLVRGAVDTIETLHTNQGQLSGLGSGFPDLDLYTNGFQPGDLYVLAARPSVGKTTLAMNIVEHVALEQRLPVGVNSLEMTAQKLTLRLMCARARVSLNDVRQGRLTERDFARMKVAAMALQHAPIRIDDSSGLSILQLRAKARRMHQLHGIRLLVVDYLQLLCSMERRSESRQQEVALISNGLKGLAKELKIPVIVLAQLNRDSEKEKRPPRLSDLRESGAIEQDADLVGLLYRKQEDPADSVRKEKEPIVLDIAKQRDGPTGDVNLLLLRTITRFESVSRIRDEDVPTD